MTQRASKVIVVLAQDEAMALIELGAALEPWTRSDSPLDRATTRLDEQAAAQMSDPYAAAAEQLRDELDMTFYEPQSDAFDYETAARRIVNRVLGVFDVE